MRGKLRLLRWSELLSACFLVDVSSRAFYDDAATRRKNGEVDDLCRLELDDVIDVQFREAQPEKPDGIRRLQGLAYRIFGGRTQMSNFNLSPHGRGFPARPSELPVASSN